MPLRQRDPATAKAQRTVEAAFHELEKHVSPADSVGFESVTLDDVRKTALDIENQLAARQSLRNMRRLEPLFTGLKYYSKSIEILCNGTPYLPWLWAPLSIILKISSDYIEAFEQIVKAYSRIGESLTRFEVLQQSFHQNPAFQQTLAIFYSDILEFHKEAYKSIRRSSWKLLFLTSWGRFQGRFDNIIDNLKHHEDQLDREANAYNIAEAKKMRESLHEWRQESLAKANQDEKEQNARQLQAVCSWLRVNDADQVVIYDQVSAEASRHPGTCSWILTQTTIAGWLSDQRNNPFVWLQGNPGCGKSVISTQIVNFLNAKNSIVASHFCSSSHASSTQYDEVLKSLLFQIIRHSGPMTAYVYGLYAGKKAASIGILEQLLQLATVVLSDDLDSSRTIYIIIDGLDDLDIDKQKRFLTLINRISRDGLSRPSSAACKFMVASRATHLIKECLRKKTIVSLSDEKHKLTEAIARYSEQRLKTHRSRFAELYLQDSDLVRIARQISQKADGMFLWARLVLNYLTYNIFYGSREIREAVDTLPRELAKFYERVLAQTITRFDTRSVERLRTIFGWIAFGRRPLRRAEFRSALSYCSGITLVEELPPAHLFDMCSPLVEERSDSGFWFIHVSVREYLQTAESVVRINRDRAYLEHAIAASTCILSGLDIFRPSYASHDRSIRVFRGLHGFHVFAYEHWIECILLALSSRDTGQDISHLFSILSEISQKLAVVTGSSNTQTESIATLEPRLEPLRQFPPLFQTAKEFLLARSQKMASHVITNDVMVDIATLRDVLDNYQITLRECLSTQEFQGITAEELAQFRLDHSRVAFICRFSSCSEGFETDIQRADHEISHATPLKCPFPSCQYPHFTTKQALTRHKRECHDDIIDRPKMKSIRRVKPFNRPHPPRENPASFGGWHQYIPSDISHNVPNSPTDEVQPLQHLNKSQPSRLLIPEDIRILTSLNASECQRYEEDLRELWAEVDICQPESFAQEQALQEVYEYSQMVMNKVKSLHPHQIARSQQPPNPESQTQAQTQAQAQAQPRQPPSPKISAASPVPSAVGQNASSFSTAPTTSNFSKGQLALLRQQIAAFKLLRKNLGIPYKMQQMLYDQREQ
ncbi:NACHT domain protein [Xylaria curta]|nr:NACHT domain protein [Xylaria curta]